MRRLALFVLVLAGCAEQEPAQVWRVYLPAVASERQPKKGVGLYAGDCGLLEMLNVEWYYSGERNCPGVEFVEYAVGAWSFNNIESTRHMLLCNEPEYQVASIEEFVTAFVPYAKAHPDTTWVGPCPSWYNLEAVEQFWAEYERQAGEPMPPERIRVCLHCYASADLCMAQVAKAATLAASMGIPQPGVWLTEFGQPLGLDTTIRQQVDEMRRLVDALEASPDVERYAYWPGLFKAGWDVPNGRYSSWQPLAVEYHDWSLSPIGVQLTDAGEMYTGK